jgi:hypothetical protein
MSMVPHVHPKPNTSNPEASAPSVEVRKVGDALARAVEE